MYIINTYPLGWGLSSRTDGDFDENRGAAPSDVASAGRPLPHVQDQAQVAGREEHELEPVHRGHRLTKLVGLFANTCNVAARHNV
jgi:hypothetical protein